MQLLSLELYAVACGTFFDSLPLRLLSESYEASPHRLLVECTGTQILLIMSSIYESIFDT